MMLATRPGLAGDLAAIIGLERSIAELPHWSEEEYARYLQPQADVARCLLVVEDLRRSLLAGFAVARRPRETTVAELESLGVLPACRRGGLGRALCMATLHWCRLSGADKVELEVRARSEGAIALYRSLGFVAVGRRPRYYDNPVDDAVLMSLVF